MFPVSDNSMSDAAEPIRLDNVWKMYGKTTALAGLTLRAAGKPVRISRTERRWEINRHPDSSRLAAANRAERSRYLAATFPRPV
jgi:hypothetical protein